MGRLTVVAVAAVFAALVAEQTFASEVVDRDVGFTLRLPGGWRRIPDQAFAQMQAAARKPGTEGPVYVAAFEPASNKLHFQHPYVLLQVHSYGQNLSVATISRSEVAELVRSLTGTRREDLTESLSDHAAGLLTDAVIEKPTVLTVHPGFVMDLKTNVAGTGSIRGRSVALFGRSNP